MKKFIIAFASFLIMVSFVPVAVYAEGEVNGNKTTPVESAELQAMKNRIQEIKAMDKSALSRMEKKELRKELRGMNSAVAARGNGIYFSIGAIVIIILLLILLL